MTLDAWEPLCSALVISSKSVVAWKRATFSVPGVDGFNTNVAQGGFASAEAARLIMSHDLGDHLRESIGEVMEREEYRRFTLLSSRGIVSSDDAREQLRMLSRQDPGGTWFWMVELGTSNAVYFRTNCDGSFRCYCGMDENSRLAVLVAAIQRECDEQLEVACCAM